jgi:hypothetical protein
MGKYHYFNNLISSITIMAFIVLSASFGHAADRKQSKHSLSCEEIYHTIDGEKIKQNNVPLGATLKVHFTGIKGFIALNGKVYPAMSIDVVSTEGQQMISAKNALDNLSVEGLPELFARNLTASIGVAEPMQEGKSYRVKIKLWDTAGSAEMSYETRFYVKGALRKENIAAQDIVSSGLNIERMIFAKDNVPSEYGAFGIGDKVQAVLVRVNGFTQGKDGLHSFDLDVEVIGPSGEAIIKQDSLLGEQGHIYLTDNTAKSPYVFIDTKGYQPGKYTVMLRIYDKITGKHATAKKSFGLFDLKQK